MSDAVPASPQASIPPAETWPYAGFWRRVTATIIDSVILLIVVVPLAAYVHPLAGLAVVLAYGAYFESSPRRATLGKQACGLQVSNVEGARLGFGRALWRQVMKLLGNALGTLTWLIFFVPMLFTPRRQGLHDLAASTVVRHEPGRGISRMLVGIIPPLAAVAAVALSIAAYTDFMMKDRVARTAMAAESYQREVEKFFAANRRMPRDLAELGMAPPASLDVQSFSLRDGRIIAEPAGFNPPGVLIFTPAIVGNAIAWKCSADRLRESILPEQCR